ncbi:hypothetical protein NL676_029895 [Syzygium grande]|nr:hypothetical protein NL676_029895 [Syzygium grande]
MGEGTARLPVTGSTGRSRGPTWRAGNSRGAIYEPPHPNPWATSTSFPLQRRTDADTREISAAHPLRREDISAVNLLG